MKKANCKCEPKDCGTVLKWKRLHEKAELRQITTGAACYDMVATKVEQVAPGLVRYGLGVAVEIPPGYVGLVFPRSSCYKLGHDLTNSVGVIDSDYRGEIMAVFETAGKQYKIGERCCQFMLLALPQHELVEVDELSATERGEGGFGSTGN